MFGSVTCRSYLTYSSSPAPDVSDSRAVIQKVERPYKTFSFQLVRASTHKMAYRKETAMHVWSHNSPIIALAEKRKISDSRAFVWCADRCHTVFELCMSKKKEERRTKSKFSHSIFSTVRRINGTLGVYFTLE